MFRKAFRTGIEEKSRGLTFLYEVVFLALVSPVFGCAGVHSRPTDDGLSPRLVYQVHLDADLMGARVSACAYSVKVGRFVSTIDARRAVFVGERGCASYLVRFDDTERMPRRTGTMVLSSQEDWLWRPDPFPRVFEASVQFFLPAGAEVASPWSKAGGRYTIKRNAFRRETFHVFGTFRRTPLAIGDSELEIVSADETLTSERLKRWLGTAAQAVATVGGRFPQPRLLVIARPVEGADTVVFGLIRRGGGVSVLLLPSHRATTEALERDWVAIHEFSHLWMPVLRDDAAWIGEGIATYLQEVLRARCGLQTPAQAWQHMLDGFTRGRRAGTGRSLLDEAQAMHRTGAYHHVYWSGAAFALEADALLRAQTDGRVSLERALVQARPRWRIDAPSPRTEAVLDTLASASGVPAIATLGRRYAAAESFPEWSPMKQQKLKEVFDDVARPQPGGCRPIGRASGESSR